MKNKKLFAILTLVCFMMTLMPVAAFAATSGEYVEAKVPSGSFADSITAKVGDVVTFQTTTGSYDYIIVNADEELVTTTPGSYQFNVAGTYKVYAATTTQVAAITGVPTLTKAEKLVLLKETSSFIDEYAVVKVKDSNVTYGVTLHTTTGAELAKVNGVYTLNIGANGGWDNRGEVVAKLARTTPDTATVKGAELTFTKAGFLNLAVEDAVTDRNGEVEFEVTSDRVGTYTMFVKYGDAKATLKVNVSGAAVATVVTENAPAAPIKLDNAIARADVKFKFADANGVGFNSVTTTNAKIAIVSQPADSDLDAADLELRPITTGSNVYRLHGKAAEAFGEEGTYVFRVTLENGKSAEATVKVAEMGDPVAIMLHKVPTTVLYTGAANELISGGSVLTVDANGVTDDVTNSTTFSVAGKAFSGADTTTAGLITLTMKNNENYIGSTITLYAVYDGFTASQTITVTDDAAALRYTKTTGEVGVTNNFSAPVVDANGARVSLAGVRINTTASAAVILEKPENAIVVPTVSYNDANDVIVLGLLASVAGDYKVQTVVVDGNGKYITSIDTFTLGAVEGTFKDVIVLSIGSNNMIKNGSVDALLAAPEIKDGRTMIPMRAGLEAFGATVDWNDTERTVTAEMNGVKVVMTVDSLDYTVNGKAMKADSAPYIKNGSTMVPAVFFTKAFGITATPLYDENGVCDVLFSK